MFLSEGRTQTVVNGNVLEDQGYSVNYDGSEMNLGLMDRGDKPVHIKMNNKELDQLLKMTENSGSSMGERLAKDFNMTDAPVVMLVAGKKKKKKTKKRKRKSKRRRGKSRRR